jgi:CelD/BcsL family acetyltransferase involved in cellulose biosynthesis
VNIGLIRGSDALAELGSALDDLHRETGAPIVARRPWLEPWIRCFGDHDPVAIVVKERGDLLAAALLARRRRRGITEIVRMGHGTSDHARFPARSPTAASALAAGILGELRGIHGPWRLSLAQFPPADPVIRRIAGRLHQATVVPGDGSPRVRFVKGRSIDRYLTRKLRRNSRAVLNRLRIAGLTPEFARLTEVEAIAEALPQIDRVRRQRDEALRKTTKLNDPQYSAFRRSVILELARRRELDMATLSIDGDMAAYAIGLLDGGSYRWWDGRIAPDWSRFSPGQLLNEWVLKWALEADGFEEFDFMRGTEWYKLRIATDIVPAENLVAWSSPLVRGMVESGGRAKTKFREVSAGLRHRGDQVASLTLAFHAGRGAPG